MSNSRNSGCLVLLVDDSAGMSAVMGGLVTDGTASTKSNGERTATSLNAFLNQLAGGPDFEIALVGYGTGADGKPNVGCRWGGALAGRDFVKLSEITASPLRTETRTRKIPAPGGFGAPREEQVQFPVWYEAKPTGKAPQIAAFKECKSLLAKWIAQAGPNSGRPIVLHVFSSSSGDGNPQMAVQEVLDISAPAGAPLVLQAHLAASPGAVASLYPSNPSYLTAGSARDLFRRSSPLPADYIAALKKDKVAVAATCRGLIYNAKMADLIRLLGLVKAEVKEWVVPAPTPTAVVAEPAPSIVSETRATAVSEPSPNVISAGDAPVASDLSAEPSTDGDSGLNVQQEFPAVVEAEKVSLVVFVLDRTVADPFSGDTENTCVKLQDHANDLLKQLSKFKGEPVDVAIVAYGLDSAGNVEVRSTFDGAAVGRTILRHTELGDGAIRVEEFIEQMSNGIGGIIDVPRKKPIFFDLEPTVAVAPGEAFSTVAGIAREWCAMHPTAWLAPIVVHLTRGAAEPAELEAAAETLKSVTATGGPPYLYHLVATETPHKSLAYPDSEIEFSEESLAKLWQVSSLLVGRDRLAAERPNISAEARGIVVNGKFDALLISLQGDVAVAAS